MSWTPQRINSNFLDVASFRTSQYYIAARSVAGQAVSGFAQIEGTFHDDAGILTFCITAPPVSIPYAGTVSGIGIYTSDALTDDTHLFMYFLPEPEETVESTILFHGFSGTYDGEIFKVAL